MRTALVLFAILFLITGCGSESPNSQAVASTAPATATLPTPVQPTPAPTPAFALVPGQTYQVREATPFYPTMNKDAAARSAAVMIPADGYFQCVRKEPSGDATWYSAQISDGAGGVYNGYIDGDALAESSVTEYTNEAATPQPQRRAPTAGYQQRAPTQTPQYSATSQAGMVYIAPQSGNKYHAKQDCRGLTKANQIVTATKAQAIAQGYEACKICGGG